MTDDEHAIIDLAIAYTWALDTKRFDDLRSVFAADATADLLGVHCDGVDAIIERIQGATERFDATQHLVGNHQVHVDGDTATHRCHLQAQHVLRGTPGRRQLPHRRQLRGPIGASPRGLAHHVPQPQPAVERRQPRRHQPLTGSVL